MAKTWKKFEALPNYFGGKRRIIADIFKRAQKKDGTFVDAFLGGGSVSLWAKAKGYRVIANDIAERSFTIGKALIENSRTKIADEDVALLFQKTDNAGFIEKTCVPKIMVSKTARFLDNAFSSLRKNFEPDSARFYLMQMLLVKYIAGTRQFAKYTHTRDTMDLEAGKFEYPFRSKSHASHNLQMISHPLPYLLKIKNLINRGVFDNHQQNEVHKLDVFEFLKNTKGDIAYFDPPYPDSSSYENEYYVLDCMLAGKKIAKDDSVFSRKDAEEFIDRMLQCAQHIPHWIISLGQTNPDRGIKPEELLEMVRRYRKAEVEVLQHRWSIQNMVQKDQSENTEYIVYTL
jgi:adenine-specific DNA methylase